MLTIHGGETAAALCMLALLARNNLYSSLQSQIYTLLSSFLVTKTGGFKLFSRSGGGERPSIMTNAAAKSMCVQNHQHAFIRKSYIT